jgi:hypothetical protein
MLSVAALRTSARLLLLALIVSALLTVSACSATVTSNNVALVITQHADTLTLAPGQTATKTVLCDTNSGEALISGGYAAPDLSLKSTVQFTNNITSGGIGHLVFGNYPSNARGFPPSAQGQVEPGWTVRATNPLPSSITLSIYANCLKGNGVSTVTAFSNAVLSGCAPLARARGVTATVPASGCGASWEVGCPTTASTLTGGGWSGDDYMQYSVDYGLGDSYPYDGHGVNDQRWVLHGGVVDNATVYAVCAKNVYGLPPVSSGFKAPIVGGSSCYPAGCGFLWTAVGTVACPKDAVLVGGGFSGGGNSISAMGQPTLLGWTVRQSIVDTFGYFNYDTNPVDETAYGVCVTTQKPKLIFITFSNYHHLLRIPADTLIAATDKRGQIPAVQHTVRVSQIASSPLAAPSAIDPFTGARYYYVPAGCGDPTPVKTAAKNALTSQLRQQISADETVFSGPTFAINQSSLTCAPGAGTRQSSPFTYVQKIDGSASESAFKAADARAYQAKQLQAAVGQLGAGYGLLSSDICPDGFVVSDASATRVTISCPTSGTARYLWTQDKLKALAAQLVGKTPDEAKAALDTTAGVQPGSEIIEGLQGARLPTDASQIQVIAVDS